VAAACSGGALEGRDGDADGMDPDALGLRDERGRAPGWLGVRRRRRRRRQQDSAWVPVRAASEAASSPPATPRSAWLTERPLPLAGAQVSTTCRGAVARTTLTPSWQRTRAPRVGASPELSGCACAAGGLPWSSPGACVCGLRVLARCCGCPSRRRPGRRCARRAGSETRFPPTARCRRWRLE